MAILLSASCSLFCWRIQKRWRELSNEDQEPLSDSPPPASPQTVCPDRYNGSKGPHQEESGDTEVDHKATAEVTCKEQDVDGIIAKSVTQDFFLQ